MMHISTEIGSSLLHLPPRPPPSEHLDISTLSIHSSQRPTPLLPLPHHYPLIRTFRNPPNPHVSQPHPRYSSRTEAVTAPSSPRSPPRPAPWCPHAHSPPSPYRPKSACTGSCTGTASAVPQPPASHSTPLTGFLSQATVQAQARLCRLLHPQMPGLPACPVFRRRPQAQNVTSDTSLGRPRIPACGSDHRCGSGSSRTAAACNGPAVPGAVAVTRREGGTPRGATVWRGGLGTGLS